MANYLVTDTDLTSVADAIRTKGGTSAQLEFPDGFVSAVEEIETGGGTDYLAQRIQNTLTSYQSTDVTSVKGNAFRSASALTSLSLPNVTQILGEAFYECGVTVFAFPKITALGSYAFDKANKAVAIDFGPGLSALPLGGLANCSALKTLILRRASGVVSLANLYAIDGSPFASGKSGGTLYVPSALIASYQAATNWSTILGYTNNSIVAIEGSIYETQYADGTPIS